MKKGFTLIELLIVVLIIGILAAIALPQYQLARDKAKFSSIMDLTNSIALAEQRYYLTASAFTSDPALLDIDFGNATLGSSTVSYNWGNCYFNAGGNSGGCILNTGGLANTIYFFGNSWKGKSCYASTSNNRAIKLCKAMTGKETPSSSSAQYTVYTF